MGRIGSDTNPLDFGTDPDPDLDPGSVFPLFKL